ncbi:MAG: aminotransferase class V-fold PLP-dependent enzyme [Alphaproteobacteria bacterium]|nr:aminotransferase class V-fold PLP-dependent enzyme [Alphaproteobacteria bacterium]
MSKSQASPRRSNESVYQRLGLRTIVNASGPSTRLTGGIMRPEVAEAMAEASQWCVDLAELQGRACEILAEATGAEAGYVTAGASAALMLASAACLAGLDPAKMNRLPDTTGMANEVVMSRSQRNMYDHAVAQAGAKLIEVGIPDRFSGAGVRDAQVWEYEAAITDKTAAILWVAQAHTEPSLKEIVTLARRHGVPVIVDAAGQLPPAENLKRFVAEGADLVAFSGGKAIGGPQASGILAGRRDLVQSAALQQLDHDTYFEQWSPPASLFDKHKLVGFPASGIGRASKCGKEEIVGLLTALKMFLEENTEERHKRWLALAQEVASGLKGVKGATVTLVDKKYKGAPAVELTVHEDELGFSARDLVKRLQDGNPSVHANHARVRDGMVVFGPTCMKPGDPAIVVERVRAELKAK